jgi:UDP-N-acetylglucosamine 1-carboxyvinyltransferase
MESGGIVFMSQLLARGGRRLTGEVTVQGAKNSVLPILAATLLTGGQVELRSCPHLRDVEVSIRVLETLGCHARWEGDSLVVDAAGMNGYAVPDTLTREMRSSALFLGAILARSGRAELSYPGGWDPLWYHRYRLEKFVRNGI